jgi:hypothetical protein
MEIASKSLSILPLLDPHNYTMPHHELAVRIQALTLLFFTQMSKALICRLTGISERSLTRLRESAIKRGFNPDHDSRILAEYVEDAPRSGRPKQISAEQEQLVLDLVTRDIAGRQKSSEYLAYEAGISMSSCLRILHKNGFSSVKPSVKPGLTDKAKAQRLQFALEHVDWTLEDWKAVIWTDETSVVLGQRRGAVQVWRREYEAHEKSYIRRRWKHASEFMFWGSFSYDKKGPCHIYLPETAHEKKVADRWLELLNQEREVACKDEWELNNPLSRLGLRNKPGRKPVWQFTEKTGKIIRNGKGGVDWYRYQMVIYPFYMI